MAPSVKNCRILLEQRFTTHMRLLTATSAWGLGENGDGGDNKLTFSNQQKLPTDTNNQYRKSSLCFSTFSEAFTCLTEKWLTKSTLQRHKTHSPLDNCNYIHCHGQTATLSKTGTFLPQANKITFVYYSSFSLITRTSLVR